MISFLVRMRIEYRNRIDDSTSVLLAKKRFLKPFIPGTGTSICVEGEDFSVRAHVSDVWWRSNATSDEVIVYANDKIFYDGTRAQTPQGDLELLQANGWECSYK